MAHWCSSLPGYEVVAESNDRRVAMGDKLHKDHRKVKQQHQLTILRWMERWTTDAEANIPAEKFKFQDRYTMNGFHPVRISAFKSHQARYYGFSRAVEGKETFFVTAIDPAKKDDEADQNMLARASREAFRVLNILKIK